MKPLITQLLEGECIDNRTFLEIFQTARNGRIRFGMGLLPVVVLVTDQANRPEDRWRGDKFTFVGNPTDGPFGTSGTNAKLANATKFKHDIHVLDCNAPGVFQYVAKVEVIGDPVHQEIRNSIGATAWQTIFSVRKISTTPSIDQRPIRYLPYGMDVSLACPDNQKTGYTETLRLLTSAGFSLVDRLNRLIAASELPYVDLCFIRRMTQMKTAALFTILDSRDGTYDLVSKRDFQFQRYYSLYEERTHALVEREIRRLIRNARNEFFKTRWKKKGRKWNVEKDSIILDGTRERAENALNNIEAEVSYDELWHEARKIAREPRHPSIQSFRPLSATKEQEQFEWSRKLVKELTKPAKQKDYSGLNFDEVMPSRRISAVDEK